MKIEDIVPTGAHVQVVHLHPGNSNKRQRRNSKYRTLVRMTTREGTGYCGEARCHKDDVPSRATGRRIAMLRMLDNFAVDSGYVNVQQSFAALGVAAADATKSLGTASRKLRGLETA